MACASASFDPPVTSCVLSSTPPWPQWVRRLYELEQREDPDIDVDAAAITPSAAVSALERAFAEPPRAGRAGLLGVLQELGWEITQDGDSLIASCETTPDAGTAVARARRRGRRDVPHMRHRRDGWPLLSWSG